MMQWAAAGFVGVAFLTTLVAAALPSEQARFVAEMQAHIERTRANLQEISASQERRSKLLDQLEEKLNKWQECK